MAPCCKSKNEFMKTNSELVASDYWLHFKIRLGIRRNRQICKPGLYALGDPDEKSDVFVSCNFKMSFNKLRSALSGVNAWILVIDTKGVNVWCAAGKGTFGTDELVSKIFDTKLQNIVSHKKIILPMLGAPGIKAREVKEKTSFKVIWGPVQADDLKKFIRNGHSNDGHMRTVAFSLMDRISLIPLELFHNFKYLVFGIIYFFILSGLDLSGILWSKGFQIGTPWILQLILVYIVGGVITPILLPLIPTRSFILKGWILGIIFISLFWNSYLTFDLFSFIGAILLFPVIASHLSFNFTGCSTYTSPSGVNWEIKKFLYPEIALALLGIIIISISIIGSL